MPEPKRENEKPWYGKTCARCDAPINYAQAAKSLMPGYCGKCIDDVRRAIIGEQRRRTGPRVAAGGDFGGDEEGGGGAGRIVLGLIVGLVLGFGIAVALGAFLPQHFTPIVELLRGVAGRT